jgi:hypothetical protein
MTQPKPTPRPLKKSTSFKFCLVCAKPRSVPMRSAQLCVVCMADTAKASAALTADVDRLARHWGYLADALIESDQHRFGKMLEVWHATKEGTTFDQATNHYRFRHRLAQTVADASPFAELCHAWWEWVLRCEDETTLAIQLVVMADDEVTR